MQYRCLKTLTLTGFEPAIPGYQNRSPMRYPLRHKAIISYFFLYNQLFNGKKKNWTFFDRRNKIS